MNGKIFKIKSFKKVLTTRNKDVKIKHVADKNRQKMRFKKSEKMI